MPSVINKLAKRNANELRRELARAHMVIALLSIGVITLLALGSHEPVSFDPTLSAICVVLLVVVTIISLCVSIALFRNKK